MSTNRNRDLAIIFAIGALPVVVAGIDFAFLSGWTWKNPRIYSLVDGIGGTIALLLAFSLRSVRLYKGRSVSVAAAGAALLSMGILLECKSFTEDMRTSIWLDTLATLMGGIIFSLSWFDTALLKIEPRFPLFAGIGSIVLTVIVFLFSQSFVPPFEFDRLSFPLREIHLAGALAFLVAAFKYGRSFLVGRDWESRVIWLICLYSGIAAALYPFSSPWGANWWLLQVLQLIPLLVALKYLFSLLAERHVKLQQSEERFRKLYEGAPVGIGLLNGDYKYAHANPALCRMLGYSLDELQGVALKSITHPDDIYSAFAARNKMLSGQSDEYQEERRYLTKAGGTITTNVFGFVIRNEGGKVRAEFRIVEDITQRKGNEKKLKQLADELSRANVQLENFAAIASHDLSSPLRTISNYIQLLMRKAKDSGDAENEKFMQLVVDGAGRMRSLIDDLLTYSRSAKPVRGQQEVDCDSVIKEALEALSEDIENSNATVEFDSLPVVCGDKTQLMQLFQNLISNSIKYRGARPPFVEISSKRIGEMWQFTVRDNGIGFDMQYAKRIFEPFQRLHTLNEFPGTGLGLSICRTIVEGMGGQIRVESKPGTGTTFFFTVPSWHMEVHHRTDDGTSRPIQEPHLH